MYQMHGDICRTIAIKKQTFCQRLIWKNFDYIQWMFQVQCRLTGPQGQGWSTRQTPMRADWTHRIHPLLRCTEFFYRRISFGLASSFAQQGAGDRYLCWVEFWHYSDLPIFTNHHNFQLRNGNYCCKTSASEEDSCLLVPNALNSSTWTGWYIKLL